MEDTPDSQDLRSEFEQAAEELDCIADAIYWGRMVQQAERFLEDIDEHLNEVGADQWRDFLNTSDVDDLRFIHEYDIEMHDEDVNGELMGSTRAYVERAKDLDDLRNLLRNEWDPCTPEISSLASGYRARCNSLCAEIKAKVESRYDV